MANADVVLEGGGVKGIGLRGLDYRRFLAGWDFERYLKTYR
jgi:hypothetical protein